MRRLIATLAAAAVLAALPHPARAEAETEIEMRVASTEYRFVDLSRSFESGLVFDVLYTGEPGMDEGLMGLGFDFSSSDRASLIPIAYAVAGRQYGERGATLGMLIYVEGSSTRFRCFLGHYFPIRGEVEAYSFVDTLEWTGVIKKRFEIGLSAAAYQIENVYEESVPAVLAEVRGNRDPIVVSPAGTLYTVETDIVRVAGPVIKWSDGVGTWAASVRFGDETEYRLVRSFAF